MGSRNNWLITCSLFLRIKTKLVAMIKTCGNKTMGNYTRQIYKQDIYKSLSFISSNYHTFLITRYVSLSLFNLYTRVQLQKLFIYNIEKFIIVFELWNTKIDSMKKRKTHQKLSVCVLKIRTRDYLKNLISQIFLRQIKCY
jgi:hypothetical protein